MTVIWLLAAMAGGNMMFLHFNGNDNKVYKKNKT